MNLCNTWEVYSKENKAIFFQKPCTFCFYFFFGNFLAHFFEFFFLDFRYEECGGIVGLFPDESAFFPGQELGYFHSFHVVCLFEEKEGTRMLFLEVGPLYFVKLWDLMNFHQVFGLFCLRYDTSEMF